MSIGAGNVIVQQKQQAGGGGGIIGARNGLTNNGGFAELGGILLQDTYIDLDAQIFRMGNNPEDNFIIQPFGNYPIQLGRINPANGINYIQLQENGGPNNPEFTLTQGLGRTMYVNGSPGAINLELGDTDAVGNGYTIQLNDGGFFWSISKRTGPGYTYEFYNLSPGNWDFKTGDIDGESGAVSYFHLDAQNTYYEMVLAGGVRFQAGANGGVYGMGDLSAIDNATQLTVNDSEKAISGQNTSFPPIGNGMRLDWHVETMTLGDYQAVLNSGTGRVFVDYINAEIGAQVAGIFWTGKDFANATIYANHAFQSVVLGDTGLTKNGTRFTVDDNAQEYEMLNVVNTGSINDSPLVITAGGKIKKMPAANPAPLAYRGGGQTTDAVTPVTILTITPADIPTDTTEGTLGTVTIRRQSDNAAETFLVTTGLSNIAGNIVLIGGTGIVPSPTQDLQDFGVSLTTNINFVTAGANQQLQVTGQVGEVLDWSILLTRNPVTKV